MSDKNQFQISGDDLGNIWVNDVLTFVADDAGMRELEIPSIVTPPGQSIADALKVSGVRRLILGVQSIDARFAMEDAIDCNHSEDVEIFVCHLYPGKKYAATVKGASKRIRFVVDHQHGHGGETDYDLGNFSDQGNGKTTGISLSVNMDDASPVRVRVLSADAPRLVNAAHQDYKVNTALGKGWFYPIYNFLKDLLKTFGISI